MKNIALMIATSLWLLSTGVSAADWSQLPEKKQTQLGLYMTAQQAYERMQNQGEKTLFIDVRSRAEVNFLGMPIQADANIPYMEMNEWYAWDAKKQNFKMQLNQDFGNFVDARLKAKGLGKDDTVILMCRSGSRSAKAANLLAKSGYTQVYTLAEGYEGDKAQEGEMKGQRVVNGWKNNHLPWTYKLDKSKMFNPDA